MHIFGSSKLRQALLSVFGSLLLLNFFLSAAMSASPGLHELLHHLGHTGAEHDHCMVDRMQRGDLADGAAPPLLIPFPRPVTYPGAAHSEPASTWVSPRDLADCRSERGPPSLG